MLKFIVARSLYCCAIKVVRSVSSCAVNLPAQFIFAPSRLRSQVYRCAIKVARSVLSRAVNEAEGIKHG